jgi:hypothetical protein
LKRKTRGRGGREEEGRIGGEEEERIWKEPVMAWLGASLNTFACRLN